MTKDTRFEAGNDFVAEGDDKGKSAAASRARNRTVMLTPEMTGQVRNMLGRDENTGRPDPVNDVMSGGWNSVEPGFSSRQSAPPAETPAETANGPAEPPMERERAITGKIARPLVSDRPHLFSDPGQHASAGVRAGAGAPPPQAAPGKAIAEAAKRGPGGSGVVSKAPKTKIVGFLITFDADQNGDVFEIRSGRWLLTSRPTDHGDYILVQDESISPLHAIIRASAEGKIQVLDQLSEFGTAVIRKGSDTEEDTTGTMVNVEHGDIVRFGKRKFVVCVVPR